MIKIHSIVAANDLKKSIAHLSSDEHRQEDEGQLRFRAVRGHLKNGAEESAGIFIGPMMLRSFVKEKDRFTTPRLFDGAIERSLYQPRTRLVLVTKSPPAPLLALVRACLLQAKLKYQVVVLAPGDKEPYAEQGEEEEVTAEGDEDKPVLQAPSQVHEIRRQIEDRPSEEYLAQAFLPGRSALLKKATSRLIGGSGKNFEPLLTALTLVEESRSPENLADLESAARAFLKHAENDYSLKDRQDKINQVKMATARKILRDLATANDMRPSRPEPQSMAPSSGDKTWPQRQQAVRDGLDRLQSSMGAPAIKEMEHQFGVARREHEGGDDIRALSLLDLVEKWVESAEQFQRESTRVEKVLRTMETKRRSKNQLELLRQQYRRAQLPAVRGSFDEALTLLNGITLQMKEWVQQELSEKVGKRQNREEGEEGEEGETKIPPLQAEWTQRSKDVKSQLDLVGTAISDPLLGKRIQGSFDQATESAKTGDFGRALSLVNAVQSMLEEAEVVPEKLFETLRMNMETQLLELGKQVPEDKLKQSRHLYGRALKLASDGKHGEAIALLERIASLPEALKKTVSWEREVELSNYLVPSTTLGSGTYGTTHLLEKTGDTGGSPNLVMKIATSVDGALELLHEEADIYRALGDHPRFAKCLGIRTVGEKEGLVMESLEGGTLNDVVSPLYRRLELGLISTEDYWGVVQYTINSTLQGLAHMDDLGYTHADIKPANVMFDSEGELRLIDLGIAQKSGTARGGTEGFRAPETVGGKGDSRADVFSVGAMLHLFGEDQAFNYRGKGLEDYGQGQGQALTQVFDKESASVVHHYFNVKRKKGGVYGVKTEYVDFVQWMLNPDPEKRPSLREAMNHPFLRERMGDDEKIREVIKGGNEPVSLGGLDSGWDHWRSVLIERGIGDKVLNEADNFISYVRSLKRNARLAAEQDLHGKMEGAINRLKEEKLKLSQELLEDKKAAEKNGSGNIPPLREKQMLDRRDVIESQIQSLVVGGNKKRDLWTDEAMERERSTFEGFKKFALANAEEATDSQVRHFWETLHKKAFADFGVRGLLSSWYGAYLS